MATLEIRMACMGEVGRNRKVAEGGALDASESLAGKRNRSRVDVAENSEEPRGNQEERRRVGDLHHGESRFEGTLECHSCHRG